MTITSNTGINPYYTQTSNSGLGMVAGSSFSTNASSTQLSNGEVEEIQKIASDPSYAMQQANSYANGTHEKAMSIEDFMKAKDTLSSAQNKLTQTYIDSVTAGKNGTDTYKAVLQSELNLSQEYWNAQGENYQGTVQTKLNMLS